MEKKTRSKKVTSLAPVLPRANAKEVKEAAQEAAETPERKAISQAQQLAKYKEKYEGYQKPDQSISMDCGDQVATLLRTAELAVVIRAAEIVRDLEPGTLEDRYASLNVGSRRMNAGNLIRGGIRDKDIAEITPAGLKVLEVALKKAYSQINKAS